MKTINTILCLLFFSPLWSQTTVGFTSPSQEFNYSQDNLSIEIEIENIASYNSITNAPIILQIHSDLADSSIISPNLNGVIEKVIIPNDYNGAFKIYIPLNEKKLKGVTSFNLFLRQKLKTSNYSFSQQSHTIILSKKDQEKTIVSVKRLDDESVSINYASDKDMVFNMVIFSDGYIPKETDGAKATFKFKDVKDFDKTYEISFHGSKSFQKLVIKNDDDKNSYSKLKDAIRKKEFIELELVKVESKVKNVSFKLNKLLKDIKLNIKKTGILSGRYNFFLGTNFDLKDRFEATSFYSEIDILLPNLINNKWGLRAGIFKNNNSTSLEEDRRIDDIIEITDTSNDSITYTRKRVNTFPNVSIENLGIYAEIIRTMHESETFKLFLGIHAEVIERREEYTFEDSDLLPLGETRISIDSIANDRRLQSLLSRPRNFSRKYYDGYFGLSSPMLYQHPDKTFEVFINPSFGLGVPGLQVGPIDERDEIRPYLATQFYIAVGGVEGKKGLGIRLGGDIRKYLNFAQNPIISINLSARVNLADILGAK